MTKDRDFTKRNSPCEDCNHKYRCDEQRLACSQFNFFVNTGRKPESLHREPTRKIYIDIFHTEPEIKPKKETA